MVRPCAWRFAGAGVTVRAIIALVLLALSAWGGWSLRGDHEDARRLRELKAAQVKLDEARALGDKLTLDLEQAKREIRTVTVEVVREVPKVTTVYVERPGDAPAPIPPAVITWGFVSLWDRALRPDLSDATGGTPSAAGRAEIARAPVDAPDLLANHAINAAGYAECRRQLNALIDWHEGLGR